MLKNRNFRFRLSIVIASILNAILLIYFAFQLLKQPYVHGDEMMVIQYSSFLKNIVLGLEKKPPRKDFIFVNVAYDRFLIDKEDDDGLRIGNQPITDRRKLAVFLNILNKNAKNYKFIIFDIFLKDKSPYDKLLAKELKKAKNILLSYHLKENDKPDYPDLKGAKGLADYSTANDVFLKFNLFYNEKYKSVPLKMYETLHKQKLKKGLLFYWLNNKRILSSFVLDFKIRNYDLFEKESYNVINLGEFLNIDEMSFQEAIEDEFLQEIIAEEVKNRIIIIGDFTETDTHQTIYGDTAGSLILLNAYLAMKDGDNVVTLTFLGFLFVSYFLISLIVFYPGNFIQDWFTRRFPNSKLDYIIAFLSFMSLLIITSITSFFIFGIHLNILYLSIYLYVLDTLVNWINKSLTKSKKE